MATPIPAFVSQWYAITGSSTVRGDESGDTQSLTDLYGGIWYYLASNRTAVSNGMSLLYAVKLALEASDVGRTWTITLSSAMRVQFAVSAGTHTVDLSSDVSAALGASTSFSVTSGTPVTAPSSPQILWTPDMPVSMTGPTQFDPAVSYGIPTSAGNMQRSPDMTSAAVSNGVQYSAEYRFNGVSPYYKAREQSGYPNQSIERFWTENISKGRRLLYWRDRSNLVGTSAPSEGSASPYNYVEYVPQPELRETMPGVPMTPYVLTHWDIGLKLWVTENGETPLSD